MAGQGSGEYPMGPYDAAPKPAGPTAEERARREVDEATNELKTTANKVNNTGSNLSRLEDGTTNLADVSRGFTANSRTVKTRMAWKDRKMTLCLILGVIALLVVIIVPSVLASKK